MSDPRTHLPGARSQGIRGWATGVRDRVLATIIGIVVIGGGALLIAFGLSLVLAIVLGVLAIGAAVYAYRRLTGRATPIGVGRVTRFGLDPRDEVFPVDGSVSHRENSHHRD